MNDALTVCEVEVYSERRGILFVDAYDNDDIMAVVMIFSYRVWYMYMYIYSNLK